MMKTRELAIEYAMSKMKDDEWVDYFVVIEWIEQSAIELGIDGSGAKQSVNLFTVDSNSRATRGKKKWTNEVWENPGIADVFISNGLINLRGKKGCMLKRYKLGDQPYVKIG
jgi:hypothetical protein